MNKNRGSQWRKWDLHIHTPASFDWSGSKRLREMNTAEKEAEIKTFITHINSSEAEVFCLNSLFKCYTIHDFARLLNDENPYPDFSITS